MKGFKNCKLYLSFLADVADQEKLIKAYRFFSENEISNFSLSLTLKNYPDTLILEDIISFFFIPTYYNSNNQLLISLICDDSIVLEDTKKKLINLSQGQGIENLMVNHLRSCEDYTDSQGSLHKLQNCIFYDSEDLLTEYRQMLRSTVFFNNLFYLNDKKRGIQSLFEIFQHAENEMEIQNPGQYQMAVQIQSLSDEIAHLRNKNTYTTNELDNYKTHIEILSSSHEAKIIQHYYDKEYEILPLWYKQLGHIIKVIMGKRSFRSLFNDNVKKYKD